MSSAISANSNVTSSSTSSGLVSCSQEKVGAIWPSTSFAIPFPPVPEERYLNHLDVLKMIDDDLIGWHDSMHGSELLKLDDQIGANPLLVLKTAKEVRETAQRVIDMYNEIETKVYDSGIIDVKIEPNCVLLLSHESLKTERRWNYDYSRINIIHGRIWDFTKVEEAIIARADKVIQDARHPLSQIVHKHYFSKS